MLASILEYKCKLSRPRHNLAIIQLCQLFTLKATKPDFSAFQSFNRLVLIVDEALCDVFGSGHCIRERYDQPL